MKNKKELELLKIEFDICSDIKNGYFAYLEQIIKKAYIYNELCNNLNEKDYEKLQELKKKAGI